MPIKVEGYSRRASHYTSSVDIVGDNWRLDFIWQFTHSFFHINRRVLHPSLCQISWSPPAKSVYFTICTQFNKFLKQYLWRLSRPGSLVVIYFSKDWFSRQKREETVATVGFSVSSTWQRLEVHQSLWGHKHIDSACVVTLRARRERQRSWTASFN